MFTQFSVLTLSLMTQSEGEVYYPSNVSAEATPNRLGGLSKRKLQQAIHYIHQHLSEEVTLEAIATHLNMSHFYFCRMFKQSTGVTPYQYLLRLRIEHAKQLLLQGDLSIVEIALEVGFANQSHLTHHFKRLVGVTPKQFVHSSPV